MDCISGLFFSNTLAASTKYNKNYLILQEKVKQLFPKDTEITHAVVLKKLHEILSARGKKVSEINVSYTFLLVYSITAYVTGQS